MPHPPPATPSARHPAFTVTAPQEVGKPVARSTVSLAQLHAMPAPYALGEPHDPERLRSTAARDYASQELLRCRLEPRAGGQAEGALPLGYSRSSAGLLPGKMPGARFAPDSTTHRADMRRYAPQPERAVPSFTLSWDAQVGEPRLSVHVGAAELNRPHFDFGRQPRDYATAAHAAHIEQVPGSGQQAHKAFGSARPSAGPWLEPGGTGAEYNIIHGGRPLARPGPAKAEIRNSFRPDEPLPRGLRYNTITGEPQRW